jgi:chromatin segregation and condensation protein Rec8/ScpA/Scc1 (kleisin family)
LSGEGFSGAGVSAAGKPKKTKTKQGGLLSLASLPSLVGQLADTINAKVAVAAKPSSIKEKDKTKAKPVEDKPAEKVDEDMKTEPVITGGAKKRKVKKPSEAGKKKPNQRNELVKKIMLEQKKSLPEASKYIKDNNLYKKS